jgi:hypothetical protein
MRHSIHQRRLRASSPVSDGHDARRRLRCRRECTYRVGFGAAALASFGTLARLAAPGERSELLAVALVMAYLAFSLPALAAGIASTAFGLHVTTVVYSAGVAALGLVALGAQRMRSARLNGQ